MGNFSRPLPPTPQFRNTNPFRQQIREVEVQQAYIPTGRPALPAPPTEIDPLSRVKLEAFLATLPAGVQENVQNKLGGKEDF